MQLVHRFSVGAPLEDVWRAFNRPDLTALCLPGATIMDTDADAVSGALKIKIGPLPLAYKGTVALRDRDEEAHRVVIDAEGTDQRGHGSIMATITAALAADDARTDVELTGDLSITGRAARFGAGVIKDASERLLEEFESQLSAGLASGELLPPEEPEPSEPEIQPSLIVELERVKPVPQPPARAPAFRPEIHPAQARVQPPRRPYVYQPPSNLAEPHWDTLVRIGRPVLRRVGPPLAIAGVLGLLIVRLVRRPER